MKKKHDTCRFTGDARSSSPLHQISIRNECLPTGSYRYQNKHSQIFTWTGTLQLIWWPSKALFFTARLHFHVKTKSNDLADFAKLWMQGGSFEPRLISEFLSFFFATLLLSPSFLFSSSLIIFPWRLLFLPCIATDKRRALVQRDSSWTLIQPQHSNGCILHAYACIYRRIRITAL